MNIIPPSREKQDQFSHPIISFQIIPVKNQIVEDRGNRLLQYHEESIAKERCFCNIIVTTLSRENWFSVSFIPLSEKTTRKAPSVICRHAKCLQRIIPNNEGAVAEAKCSSPFFIADHIDYLCRTTFGSTASISTKAVFSFVRSRYTGTSLAVNISEGSKYR